MTELQKIRDPLTREIIEESLIESLSFGEWVEVMTNFGVPAWFDLAKCWQEETGETIKRAVSP